MCFFAIAGSFVDSQRCVPCFAETYADLAFFISRNYCNREAESSSSGSDSSHSADIDDTCVELRLYSIFSVTSA